MLGFGVEKGSEWGKIGLVLGAEGTYGFAKTVGNK